MERRPFGKTDMRVSVLGFGGSEIGFGDAPQADVDALLGSAIDQGLNAIDTAECYAGSEEKIGRAVGSRRHEIYLFTKCGHASGLEGQDWEPDTLRRSIDRSLERLRTDHVDLMQLHSCSEELLRQGDVIDVLRRAKEAGKTRYIGYSGDRNNAAYAVACGAFDALQTSVNIADQEAIDTTIPLAAEYQMGVIAKRPVANVAWKAGIVNVEPYARPYWERLRQLGYPFLDLPFEQAFSIALRWTLSQPGIATAIVGTKRPNRGAENARYVAEGPLSPELLGEIRRLWSERKEADWVGQG